MWEGAQSRTPEGYTFIANIPTEEVFTAPHRLRVNGVVKGTKPYVYNGNLIEGFSVTFKDGEVVEHSAQSGEALLGQLLDTDEGSRRIGEIADATARAFRGSASVEELASAPPLKNDEALTEQMARCAEMLFGEKSVYRLREGGMGSEDFASYTYELPCAYLLLGAGTAQEDARYGKPMHNESVVFNENILPRGSALLAYGAMQWLEDRQ